MSATASASSTGSQYKVCAYRDWKGRFASLFNDTYAEFSSLPKDILAYLDTLGIQTVVEESEYIDEDYSAAYSHFYSYFFRPPTKSCTRHLFFSDAFRQIEDIHPPTNSNGFKGFVTVWPTCPPVIGRSVLPFPEGADHRVEADYEAHVAGKKLGMRSAMFASKDHGVSVCASITTWLAADIMRRKFGLRGCSSTEITLLATGDDPKWSRPLPQTRGLDSEQITRALTILDHGPYAYYVSDASFKWRGLLYGYICSGIPVIILCEMLDLPQTAGLSPMHAVLAVGIKTRRGAEGHEGTIALSFTRTVDSFVVHDDRFGAFANLCSEPDSTLAIMKYQQNSNQRVSIKALLVPLPKRVIVPAEHAYALGVSVLGTFLTTGEEAPYVGPFRTFLRDSTEFKRDTLKWPKEKQAVAARIRSTPMPHWVWVSEAYPSTATFPRGEPLARAVFDSTQLRFAGRALFVTGHIGNVLLDPGRSVNST